MLEFMCRDCDNTEADVPSYAEASQCFKTSGLEAVCALFYDAMLSGTHFLQHLS